MPSFNDEIDRLDGIHQATFAINVLINGEESMGIFDEETDEFEGTNDIYRTLELPMSALPSTPINNGESTVYLVDDDRTFTIHRHDRIGQNVTLVLR